MLHDPAAARGQARPTCGRTAPTLASSAAVDVGRGRAGGSAVDQVARLGRDHRQLGREAVQGGAGVQRLLHVGAERGLVDDREHALLRARAGDRPAEIVDRRGTQHRDALRRQAGRAAAGVRRGLRDRSPVWKIAGREGSLGAEVLAQRGQECGGGRGRSSIAVRSVVGRCRPITRLYRRREQHLPPLWRGNDHAMALSRNGRTGYRQAGAKGPEQVSRRTMNRDIASPCAGGTQ